MPGEFVDTNHRGVTKQTYSNPGGYEQGEAGRVMLPEVSGEGGFGAHGEYKKYPKIKINEYDTDDGEMILTDKRVIEEISFTPTSPDQDGLGAPGKVPVKAKEAPKKKRKSRKATAVQVKEDPSEQTLVTFSGSFGETTAPYEQVFFSGINMVLVANTNAAFSYSPPQNEEGFAVLVDDEEYQAYSVGISFILPGTNKKITVLLVDEND